MVRAPKHDAAGAAMEGEIGLLEGLANAVDDGLLPFDVPRPAGFAPLPEGGRAMVYPELIGSPVPPSALHRPAALGPLAEAIAALHNLPIEVVQRTDLPVYDAEGYRARRLAEVDEAARTGHLPGRLLRRWEQALEDVTLWRFGATCVHGDLAAEHVIVDGDRVVGIIDWADARVADPADDLAWLLTQSSSANATVILDRYASIRHGGADETLAARARLAGELALVRWLMHGVRVRSDEIIEDAIDMLRDLDSAVADADPIGRQAEPDLTAAPEQMPEPDNAPTAELPLDERRE